MISKSAKEVVSKAYLEYGKYVNLHRAFPSIKDGLKPIQRKLILAAIDSKCTRDYVKSATVVGTTIAKYNPHGDSSAYGALVTMVNAQHPLIVGHGNWGYVGLANAAPAAMRYTSCKLNSNYDLYKELMSHVPNSTNDLGFHEVEYLPIGIPFAMLNGSIGIGVGVTSRIPPFSIRSLKRAVREYFNNGHITSNILPSPGRAGNIKYSQDELQSLNDDGIGTVTVSADVKLNGRSITITNIPDAIPPSRVYGALHQYLVDSKVVIIDESADEVRITIEPMKHARGVDMNHIYSILKKAFTKRVTYKIVVEDYPHVRRVGAKEFLEHSLKVLKDAYQEYLKHKRDIIDLDIVFLTHHARVAKLLIAGKDESSIRNELNLTKEQYAYITRKSISTLSKSRSATELNDKKIELKEVNKKLKSIAISTLEYFESHNMGIK